VRVHFKFNSFPDEPIHVSGFSGEEPSSYKIQTPGNYPEENMQHTEHGESLKSRIRM
jgi:hypothetical protein